MIWCLKVSTRAGEFNGAYISLKISESDTYTNMCNFGLKGVKSDLRGLETRFIDIQKYLLESENSMRHYKNQNHAIRIFLDVPLNFLA